MSSGTSTVAPLSSSGACAAAAAFVAAGSAAALVAVATTTTGAERSSSLVNVTVSVSGAVLASTDTAGEGSRVCAAGGLAPAGSSWPALTASM